MFRIFERIHTPKFYSDFATYLAADSIALLRKLPRLMDDLFLDAWNKSLANEAEREAAFARFMAIMELCGTMAQGWEVITNGADDASKQDHSSQWS